MLNLDYRDARPIYDGRKDGLLQTFDQTAGELLFLGVSGEALWARIRALEGGEKHD